ncbi:MAG TPA: alanine--tRNA ligase [Anaerolineales bacterium]|nr:alanine--tRNA ligase [Anaerolineales bacterium]
MDNDIPPHLTGNAIRKTFIDYFAENRHTHVPSSPLVPGGDSTLLFTNSGMVQFKDVFLGTDKRPYTRAANSQKCLRVAGKHNDLDDVGRDDTHHTFFEMLGNWSFGDYYKKEAIEWAWHLLTDVWGLPKDRLYATVFKDEQDQIPTDEEAADLWRAQPGFVPDHLFYFGRSDNFWEMADTGPCGPNSEIHIDLRPEDGPVRKEDIDTDRFLELWNLVFMQYNRLDPDTLEPLPATHVDTGMGFERIVAVLQGVDSNYRTDLLWPLILKTQALAGQTDDEREADLTPYRVIADHARAAAFLIADGVIPGNLGRNYVARMIIRRAYRFGGKLGLAEPFLAEVAEVVIDNYGEAFPELEKSRGAIRRYITREEEQFQRTLERATAHLSGLLDDLARSGGDTLPGAAAADLYTTYGMPLEITKDIAEERGLKVDEPGFGDAMDAHRLASGAGAAMGVMGEADTDLYRQIRTRLQSEGRLPEDGVAYNPFGDLAVAGEILALIVNGQPVPSASEGDEVDVIIPETPFYIEAGGQVSDTGVISPPSIPPEGGGWEIVISSLRRPAAGIIVHHGLVVHGTLRVGDAAIAAVDPVRRMDIMRNHTATHLLHSGLHAALGDHARQAGSLVAPDRLRFDFTHPEAVSPEQLEQIETFVNEKVLENFPVRIDFKPLDEAKAEGAIALFGEKYADVVRTVRVGDFSYELCGGTHLRGTAEVGLFTITSEGSAAAGIRRIEAVTGREAYRRAQQRRRILSDAARALGTGPDGLVEKTAALLETVSTAQKELQGLRTAAAGDRFERLLDETTAVGEVQVLTARLDDAGADTLRGLADRFREHRPENGVAVLAAVNDGKPIIIAAVTKDLNPRGLLAGDLANFVARRLGGGGGGGPTLAQAGGRSAENLDEALAAVAGWVAENMEK